MRVDLGEREGAGGLGRGEERKTIWSVMYEKKFKFKEDLKGQYVAVRLSTHVMCAHVETGGKTQMLLRTHPACPLRQGLLLGSGTHLFR